MPEKEEKERELKAAFIQHLPERIASIKGDWGRLTSSEWDHLRLKNLYQKVQNLTGASGQYGLISLSESSFSLEVYLNTLIDTDNPLSTDQKETGSTLINAMKHEVNLTRNKPGIDQPEERLIYLLHSNREIAPGLTDMLEEHDFTVLSFNHPDDVEGEVQRRLPNVLIIDAEFLPHIGLLNRELAIQQERHKTQVGIVCLSQSRDLEQRLLALRSGVDAYYLTPINTQDLVANIIELASPKHESYRILVVEDDQSQADFAASILKKSGMTTLAITDPMKVIDVLDKFRPDLILMDLYMPNASGTELTTIIREHPDFIMTPIVFLSGEQDTDKQLQALSVGGDDFLSKPIRPRHLINTISNRVERTRILEKKRQSKGSRDPVTGLYNRRYFYEKLDALTTDTEQRNTLGGVLYITLPEDSISNKPDEFDRYMATLGNHIIGVLEEQDIASRIDESSIAILVLRPHQKNIIALSEKISARIQRLKKGGKLSPHIGIALFNKEGINASELMANASAACAEIQHSTQLMKIYEAGDGTTAPSKQPTLPVLLKQALQENGFQLLFRALGHPHKAETEVYELKLRLRLPGGKQLGNADILSLANEEGLATQVSQWLVERALITLEEKRAEGKQISLLVELSTSTIFQNTITEWLKKQLRARQMVGFGLIFQYRIADLSTNLKVSKQHFDELRDMGIKIALSRYGASNAAIKVLQYLRAEYVHIAGPVLEANDKEISEIIEQIHQSNTKIILPTRSEPGSITPRWRDSADLVPIISGTTRH
jgi:PleD family two-component response regulator/EAL domain-containing protein (putative c-di-GMP-specific phosphodiesterase class I)